MRLKDLLEVIPLNQHFDVYNQDDDTLFSGQKESLLSKELKSIGDCTVTDIQGTTYFKSEAFDENGRVDILDGTDLLLIWVLF